MSEPEGYAEDGKRDLMPKEYIAKVVFYINFENRIEPPDEHEIKKVVNDKIIDTTIFDEPFTIESVELA